MQEHDYLPEQAIDYIRYEFSLRKSRRPHYSLRAFARDLELSPSTVSELIQEKVGLSKARALQIAKKLKLNPLHTEHFCDLISSAHARNPTEKKEAQIRARSRIRSQKSMLSLDQFKLIADWQHFAILELLELHNKYHSIKSLALSLNLSENTITQSLKRLERLNLIQTHENFYAVTSTKTTVGEETPSLALQRFHTQLLDKAKLALSTQSLQQRDFQNTIFTLRKKELPQFKKDLEQASSALIQKYFHKDKKDVLYCLSFQLFQLNEDII